MFKVTEILKGSQGRTSYMQYQRDGSAAGAMTCVGQILTHHADSLEDLVTSDGIVIDVVGEDEANAGETLAFSAMGMSDIEIMTSVMAFIRHTHGARWDGKEFSFNKLVIQF